MEERQTSRPTGEAQRTLERGLEPSSFELPRTSKARNGSKPRTGADLHVCPCCDSRLVYPTTWQMSDRDRWIVSLRCPECEWHGGGIYGQTVLERFDEVLDRGTEEMIEDLKVLARANMQEDLERFATALREDHILPEDF